MLVDSQGRSSLGRFLSVKPDLGVLTSTARTFIQEGVTTQYATQVLGTTLDNGRLYAHLLTKSSRVLYDDTPTTRSFDASNKKWQFENRINGKSINFVKNTDFVSPNRVDTFLVFPTAKPKMYKFVEKEITDIQNETPYLSLESNEEYNELLKSAPSNNPRVPYVQEEQKREFYDTKLQNNVKVYQIYPQFQDVNSFENAINHKDIKSENEIKIKGDTGNIEPSKIRPWNNIPTITVRNDFSPSGFAYLGDLPDFDISTESNKPTTVAERKAKLLFRARKPNKLDLKTVTYTGFADFTTTVGDTVIVFSPQTSEVTIPNQGQVTSISVAATIKPTIRSTPTKDPLVATTVRTFLSQEPEMETHTVEGHKLDMHSMLATMVIDAANRTREAKNENIDEISNEEAKLAVLAKEQKFEFKPKIMEPQTIKPEIITPETIKPETIIPETTQPETIPPEITTEMEPPTERLTEETITEETVTEESVTPEMITEESIPIEVSPEVIQPSETQIPMLSTPSDEDIAKILASLQALAANQATQPLNNINSASKVTETITTTAESTPKSLGGATTIFFEDLPIASTPVLEYPSTSVSEESHPTTNLPTTESATTEKIMDVLTEKQPETTTTEKQRETTPKAPTTTEKEFTNEINLTNEENPTTNSLQPVIPEKDSNQINTEASKSQDEKDEEVRTDVTCTQGSQILPTTAYQTLTYLTTFYIPTGDTTSLSVKSNIVISTDIGFQTRACTKQIEPSKSLNEQIAPTVLIKEQETTTTSATTKNSQETITELLLTSELTTELESTTEQHSTKETPALDITTPTEITTERRHVTESESETTEATTESGEEIELLFKTLFTTYTYLTTYFQESSSSIESRKVVITNVITSTLDPGKGSSDPAVAGLFERDSSLISTYKSKPITFEDFADIAPTSVVATKQPENTRNKNILFDNVSLPSKSLSNGNVKQVVNGIKTYYTTYTYFTTIFVDDQTEISSRTEVYTNYVTPSIQVSATTKQLEATTVPDLIFTPSIEKNNEEFTEKTLIDEDDEEAVIRKKIMKLNIAPSNSYSSTINRQKTVKKNITNKSADVYASIKGKLDNNIVVSSVSNKPFYSTLQRSTTENAVANKNYLNLSEYETISTMVTDVRSSTSEGKRTILDNPDKGNVLEDQIVSETNNDSEIIASPTLLLQTSYTTFTYFTTMYHGTTSSNVVSRLETITNIVTETLSPTQSITVEESSLPVTYFTTFTYWTTLYKEGTTKVTSREETVSNVISPTSSASLDPSSISVTPLIDTVGIDIKPTSTLEASSTKSDESEDELTTFYTTYTYYTTSYNGNSTVLNSRLETVTNIINKTLDADSNTIGTTSETNKIIEDTKIQSVINETQILLPTGLLSTVVSTVENSGIKTILSTDIFGTYIDGLYAKVLESTSIIVTEPIISTATTENLKPTGVVSINQGKIVDAESVSTLFYTTKAVGTYIDNLYAQVIESTSSLQVDEERKAALPTDLPVAHRTGLVRLIEGSIIQNHTTTLYQSKVLGTLIDGRYAQIIESTSSFIVDKIQPSILPSGTIISPSATKAPSDEINPSNVPISPSPVVIESSLTDSAKLEDENITEEEEDEEEHEEDNVNNTRVKSRLTLKTRSRTFTPAIRPFVSRPRPTFAPKRKGSGPGGATTITRSDFTPTVTAIPASKSGNRFGGRKSSSGATIAAPTASGSRRFSRPKSSAAGGVANTSRARSTGRIQPTALFGSSSRRGGVRSSGPGGIRPSSANINNRLRIRPTSALGRFSNSNAVTPPSNNINDDENDLTTVITDDPTGITYDDTDTTLPTTESSARRSQNPLLRFRRPPLSRPPTPSKTVAKSGNRNANKANGKLPKTTQKPKSSFNRPIPAIQNRPRPGNGLFPRRGLFTTTTPPPEEEEDAEEELLEEEGAGEDEDDDTEYDGSNTEIQTEEAPDQITRKSRSSIVKIKPFGGLLKRSKRQAIHSRFRRPGGKTTTAAPTEAPTTAKPKTRSGKGRSGRTRSISNNKGNSFSKGTTPAPKRISPTKASSHGRSQFTLREKDTTSKPRSNFRRPSSKSSSKPSRTRTTTVSSRPKAPRLRTSQNETPKTSRKATPLSNRASTNNNNNNNRAAPRRAPSRSRPTPSNSGEQIDNFVLPTFDGTITVTYQIPTEVTIPIVNGQMTEYKNVITAKYSTEVLGPKQYTSTVDQYGKGVTVLLSETTGIGANGATQITQFTLNETPTTSVIFTPTYIRGHKTSFSHIIPSTAYGVEEVVNTIQPALSAQAPLANILLSQLLLGQIGYQQQNPLFQGLQPGVAGTPTTEVKTRTTTYVTTVTSATSTVIPLTFRGKEILTTIIDSSTTVVTATEFLTETITVTPTAGFPGGNQLNSLLVPLLLQQQQQPQPINPIQQQPVGVFNLKQDQPQAQALYMEPKPTNKFNDDLFDENDNYNEQLLGDDVTEKPKRKVSRKKNKKTVTQVQPTIETSIVTLYVSGKVPGEFSTVLSTVVVDNNRRKREISFFPVEASKTIEKVKMSTFEYLDSYIMPAVKDVNIQATEISEATESLESIIGDVSKHISSESRIDNYTPSNTFKVKYVKTNYRSPIESAGNFLVL